MEARQGRISGGWGEIEQCNQNVRLQTRTGKGGGVRGRESDRMAQAVEDNIQGRKSSGEAQAGVDEQREFTMLLQLTAIPT